ncbi:Probable aquaporin NIP-type [Linum perenne]
MMQVSAELIGTYILILVGCGSVAVNSIYGKATAPGVAVCWGFIVTLLAYSVGHVSGAHFNPAVTLSAAFFRGFPIRLVRKVKLTTTSFENQCDQILILHAWLIN